MKRLSSVGLATAAAFSLFLAAPLEAHFGMLIPSASTVENQQESEIQLELSFSHPMEKVGMDMARPASFSVSKDGQRQELKDSLQPAQIMGRQGWQAEYTIQRPGLYSFALEPEPYFEPAEDCYIVHYTKTFIPAFGQEEGWDTPLGLKTEIVPLSRPFANYAGNLFQGQVLLDGQPVPGAIVEVEYYNRDGQRRAPNEYFVTQSVKADPNGIFTYSVPWAGWWGFAALNTAKEKMDYEGSPKDIELGAVIWVEFSPEPAK